MLPRTCQHSSCRGRIDFDLDEATGLTEMRGKSPGRRASTILLGAILALLTPTVAASRDEILTVGGQNLHIEMFGESGPTVVFEAGLGNDTSTWRLVAAPVAKFARVVLYDRAGLGQSMPFDTSAAITADLVATRLHNLLSAAGIHPPYVLSGTRWAVSMCKCSAENIGMRFPGSSCWILQAPRRRAN